jgi:putative intracellular protease/amidase
VTDKTIAFVLYLWLTPLDLVGPLQVMCGLELVETTFGMQPRHHAVVVAESLDAVPTDTPLRVAAITTLDEVPEPDIVMAPGGRQPMSARRGSAQLTPYGAGRKWLVVDVDVVIRGVVGDLLGQRWVLHAAE